MVPYDQLGTEDQDSTIPLIETPKSDKMEQNSLHGQINNSDSEHTESETSDSNSSKKASADKDHMKVGSRSTVPLDKGNELLKSVSEIATR